MTSTKITINISLVDLIQGYTISYNYTRKCAPPPSTKVVFDIVGGILK